MKNTYMTIATHTHTHTEMMFAAGEEAPNQL